MLNSLRRYFAAAIAPVFLNIILIGVLAYAWYEGHDGLAVGYGLAWGVLAAGLVQLAIVWVAVRHAGITDRLPPAAPDAQRQAAAVACASRRRSPAASPRSIS